MTLVYLDQAEEADGLVAPGPRSPIIDPLFADAVWYVDARLRADGTSLGATSGLDASSVVHVAAGDVAAGTYAYETSAAHCPDAADIDLTDGFCVAVDVTTDWRPTVAQQILAKPRTGDPDTNDCYAVGFDDSGHPFIEWHDTTDGHNGPAFITGNGATANVTFDDGVARRHLVYEFIADNGQGGWTARIYSGTPGTTTLLSEIVNTTAGAQTIVTSTDNLRIGDPCNGAIHRVRLYDEMDGTLLRDFYPARDWTSGTTMASDTGEVWSSVLILEGPVFAALNVADNPALDVAADDSATWAFWFTQRDIANIDGEVFRLVDRQQGTIDAGGEGLLLIDIKIAASFADFAGAVISDGTDNGLALGAHWAAGEHLAVFVIDRDTDIATLYLDGTSHATADISAVGAIDPAAELTLGAASHHAAAKWDAVLDPADIAAAFGV